KVLKHVYSDDCVGRAQVFRWFARFQEGRVSPEDDRCPGLPVSARSNENVEKARPIVMVDKRIATRFLAERLGV
ncbi:hypothetical protein Cfor_05639, partial [Coptotermes formosanus]